MKVLRLFVRAVIWTGVVLLLVTAAIIRAVTRGCQVTG